MNLEVWAIFAIATASVVAGVLLVRFRRSDQSGKPSALSDSQYGSEDLLCRVIFEALPLATLVIDMEDSGRAIMANPKWFEIMGYAKEEIIGKTYYQLDIWADPGDREFSRTQLMTKGGHGGAEIQLKRAGGLSVWCRISAQRLSVGGRNLAIYSGEVIDDQKESERALRESNELFERIFDMIPEGLVVTGADNIYRKVNQTWLDKTGYTREQIIGRTSDDLNLWPYPEEPQRLRTLAARWGEVNGERMHARMANGSILVGEMFGRLTRFRGEVIGLWLTRDITAREEIAQELADQQDQLQKTFNVLPNALLITDATRGTILSVNPAWEQLNGRQASDVVGKTTLEVGIYTSEDEHLRNHIRAQILKNGAVDRFELRFRHSSGRPILTEVSARVIHNRGVDQMVFSITDVTESRRMIEALQESREALKGTFRLLPEPLFVTDDRDGRVLDVNPAWEALFEHEREHALGLTLTELGVFAGGEGAVQALMSGLKLMGTVDRMEVQLATSKGEPLVAEISGSQQVSDKRVTYIFVVRDVTDNRRLIQELQLRKQTLSQILDMLPEAISTSDTKTGVVQDLNRYWEIKFGYPRDSIVGQVLGATNLWPNKNRYREMIGTFYDAGQLDAEPLEIFNSRGEVLQTEISSRTIDAVGGSITVTVARDVTQQKRAERALADLNATLETKVQERTKELSEALELVKQTQAELVRSDRLASLGSLVAGVAHELNTPLGNAMMAVSTISEARNKFDVDFNGPGVTKSSLKRFMDVVSAGSEILYRSVSRASELVSSFKQIAVDQTSHQRRRFEITATVSEVLVILNPSIANKGAKVVLDFAEPIEMESYAGPLAQVLMNLVNNALLHAFDGKESGIITIKAVLAPADKVVLTVCDDGNGIPAENLDRVFDPFFTTKLGQGGSGLGLHICFNLISELLGGNVALKSEVGTGTCFTIELPRIAPLNERTDPDKETSQ